MTRRTRPSPVRPMLAALVSFALTVTMVPAAMAAPSGDATPPDSDGRAVHSPDATEAGSGDDPLWGLLEDPESGETGGGDPVQEPVPTPTPTTAPDATPIPTEPPGDPTGEPPADPTQEPSAEPEAGGDELGRGEFQYGGELPEDIEPRSLRAAPLSGAADYRAERLAKILSGVNLGTNGGYTDYGGAQGVSTHYAASTSCMTTVADAGRLRVASACESGVLKTMLVDPTARTVTETNSVTLSGTLPKVGAVHMAGDGYIYLLTGEDNSEENPAKEVIRISRYTTGLSAAGSVGFRADAVEDKIETPFRSSNARLAIVGDQLFIHTARRMFIGDDGLRHQSNLTLQVNKDLSGSVTAKGPFYNWASHSFKQFVMPYGSGVVYVDHGDAYPRTIQIGAAAVADARVPTDRKASLLDLLGTKGENYTGATVGGAAISGSTAAVVGRAAPHNHAVQGITGYKDQNAAGQSVSNVYVALSNLSTTPLSNGTTFKWLTNNHPTLSDTVVQEPTVTAISGNRFAVLWATQKADGSGKRLEYRLLSSTGAEQASFHIDGLEYFPAADPQMVGTKLTWIGQSARSYSNGTDNYVYALDLADPERPSAVVVPDPPFESAPKPVINDASPSVGETVSVDIGTWKPTPQTVTYQWNRNGSAIPGATGATYAIADDNYSQKLSVSVTASAPNVATMTVTSDEVSVWSGSFTNHTKPEISGTARVGQVLSASQGTWTPVPTSARYQWTRDGSAISGATSSTYQLTSADLGALIRVQVTPSRYGYMAYWPATSDPTAKVLKAALTATPKPQITGSATLGGTLTAEPGTWGPAPVALSYQWKRGGETISNATSAKYTPVAADVTKTLTVVVTGAKDGYESVSMESAPTAPIPYRNFTVNRAPSLGGTAVAGQRLTVDNGSWSPTPESFTYVWKCGDAEIARGGSYNYLDVTAEHAGCQISADVTASTPGFRQLVLTTGRTAAVPSVPFLASPNPTVSGSPRVGQQLTAVTSGWSPSASFTYQWSREGQVIAGATKRTYDVTIEDAGFRLQVTVRGTSPGYTPTERTSEYTATVPLLDIAGDSVRVAGTPAVGQQLTAVATHPGPAPASDRPPEYQWLRGGTAIPGATSNTYDVGLDDVGAKLSVRMVTYRRGYNPTTVTSPATVSVPKATFQGPAPKIAIETLKVGNWVEVYEISFTPVPDSVTYQWLRDNQPISGATDRTYVFQAADIDHRISVTVTAHKEPKYESLSLTSVQTSAIVARDFQTRGTPSVSGQARVGQTLYGFAGSWSPTPGGYEWQWLRDGVEIPGATKSSYYVQPADAGSRLSVRVIPLLDSYSRQPAVSAQTSEVPALQFGNLDDTWITASNGMQVGKQVMVQDGMSFTPDPTTLPGGSRTYQWYCGAQPIAGATGVQFVITPNEYFNCPTTLRASVTAKAPGYRTVTNWAEPHANAIRPGDYANLTKPVLSGTGRVGETLSVSKGTWQGVTPFEFEYHWFRDDGTQVGDLGSTYVPTGDDIGHSISVAVRGIGHGYGYNDYPGIATNRVTVTPAWGDRIFGNSRFATAAEVSKRAFPDPSTVRTVTIANGRGFADSLSAAPFAAKKEGPLLLVEKDSVPEVTLAEIRRLKPSELFIVGGDGVVSTKVEQQLKDLVRGQMALPQYFYFQRMGESDRYRTSIAVAHAGWWQAKPKYAFFATGLDYPDALAAGAAAASGVRGDRGAFPVILVPGNADRQPWDQWYAMKDLVTERGFIAGGNGVVSDGVRNSLQVPTKRLNGNNRFETSAAIAREFADPGADVFLATGRGFADALAGSVMAGMQDSPLMLSEASCIPAPVHSQTVALKPGRTYLLGGDGVLAENVRRLGVCR